MFVMSFYILKDAIGNGHVSLCCVIVSDFDTNGHRSLFNVFFLIYDIVCVWYYLVNIYYKSCHGCQM